MVERCKGNKETSKGGTGGKVIDSSSPNGGIARKVRTVEEQAEVRGSWKAVWCKRGKDACKGGTDIGEILQWCNGARVASSRASEERAVERQICQRRNGGLFAAKVRTLEEEAEVRDSLKSEWCKGGKDACNSGTDNGEIPRQHHGAKGGEQLRNGR